MAKIKDFQKFKGFFEYNYDRLFSNYYVHFHFLNKLEELNKGTIVDHRAFNVVDDEGNDIIFIWVSNCCYLYSDNWTPEMVNVLLAEIQFSRFTKHFEFAGQKDLIEEVLNAAKASYQTHKDRLVYKINKASSIIDNIIGEVFNATLLDFDDILDLSMQNYEEEYQGMGQRTKDQMAGGLMVGINTNNLFVLRESGRIESIVQLISTEEDQPIIGNLFTRKESRNKGYAFKLLHTVSKGLLDNGYEDLGLFSDATNPASNAVFNKIGYEAIYKFSIFFITD